MTDVRTRLMGVAAAIAALCFSTVSRADNPDAQQILDRMAEVYANAEDYTAESRASFSLTMMGGTQREHMHQSAVFKRPNKVYHRTRVSVAPLAYKTLVCDGKDLYEGIDVLRQYTMQAAPAKVSEIQELVSEGGPGDAGTMFDVPQLLDGVDLDSLVKEARLEREGRYRGEPVWVLELTFEDGNVERLWVGQQDYLIRKLEFIVNMAGMMGDVRAEMEKTLEGLKPNAEEGAAPTDVTDEEEKAGGEEGEPAFDEAFARAIMEAMLEQFGNMEMRATIRHTRVAINTGVSDDLFRFALGPKYHRVRELDEVPVLGEEELEEALGGGPGAMPTEAPPGLTGQEAPDFTLSDLAGNEVTLSALRGKPVLLDFWASWCPPCRQELPHIQELHQELAGDGLQVIGVSTDSAIDGAKAGAEEMGLTFPVLWMNPQGPAAAVVGEAYQLTSIPRVLLIDADGTIRADLTGYHEKQQLLEELGKVGF